MSNDLNKGFATPIAILTGALVVAMGVSGYLWVRSNHLSDEIAKMQDGTSVQIAQLGAANEAQRAEAQRRFDELTASLSESSTAATTASKRQRAEAQLQAKKLQEQIAQQQEELNGQITTLKDSDAETANKITEVATNVTGVKGEVDEVKTEVGGVKELASTTKSAVEQHALELKRMTGDMGVMSDHIATNGKDLEALRALGERNYYEFKLAKNDKSKKIGDTILTLKKADPKRNRFTVDVVADDKKVEKKDKTINEPVQIFLAGNKQASEIVVNQVNKDEIVGYISVPKVIVSRR